jgi:hypothetical protein
MSGPAGPRRAAMTTEVMTAHCAAALHVGIQPDELHDCGSVGTVVTRSGLPQLVSHGYGCS